MSFVMFLCFPLCNTLYMIKHINSDDTVCNAYMYTLSACTNLLYLKNCVKEECKNLWDCRLQNDEERGKLRAGVSCSWCYEDAEVRRRVGLGAGYASYFCQSQSLAKKQKSMGACDASLADSAALGTTAISSPLAQLALLLGATTERWERVLVWFVNPEASM